LVALAFVAEASAAEKNYDPGVSDTEIKIGQTMPYSGPVSVYGQVGHAQQAYFAKINAEGGINGRKINLISLDDGYMPPKALEQVRRLVEHDKSPVGIQLRGYATNIVLREYLNSQKVPHLFVAGGDAAWGDYQHYPWTIGWGSSYQAEGKLYAEHILTNRPNAKIAVLSLNDDYDRDYVRGFKDGLAERASTMIVREQTYDITDPTVDSQIVTLKASGGYPFCCRRRKTGEPGLPQDLRYRLAAANLHCRCGILDRRHLEASGLKNRDGFHHRLLRQVARLPDYSR